MRRIAFLFFISFFFFTLKVNAQLKLLHALDTKVDTNYIKNQSELLTIRALGSSKLSSYKLINKGNTLTYKANNSYNAGLGAVYRFLGVNIVAKIPGVVNDDNARYGKTKKLDIQAYLFLRKLALDLYGQWYKGFYIQEKDIFKTHTTLNQHIQRPDIRTLHIGGDGSYVFNAKRFSFRAAFMQNEYQKKSAGTALLGGGIHYDNITGDTSIIPSNISYDHFFGNDHFNKLGTLSMNIHGGYGYTLVIAQHFYATAVALLGFGANYSYIKDDASDTYKKAIGIQENLSYKIGIGYNSNTFYASLFYIGYAETGATPYVRAIQQYQSGMARLVFAKRFKVHPFWKKKAATFLELP